jgi:hypothetical protein
MRRRNNWLRSVVLAGATAVLTVSGLILASAGSAASGHISQIASDGISTPPDSGNDYSWSMAWFNGSLYVGTSRYEGCVEKATQDFYFPGRGYYPGKPTGGYTCPADKYDLQLQAEIWRYTPTTNKWTMVYQSPEIPNPAAPGKMIGRDIGYRSMVVYNNELYVAANTADEYIPALAATNPPVILHTSDGTNFTPVNGAPSTMNYFNGPVAPMGYRALAVYNNQLFVTVIHDLTGDGVLERIDNPSSPDPNGATFTQITPPSMRVFELQVFNNQLYLGTGDADLGYAVYRTNASGNTPTYTPVVTGGAGRGKAISSVVSMGVFQNHLYIGASGWFNSTTPESEEIRVSTTGKLDLIAGQPRKTSQGFKKPLSSLPDGFGNIFNAHFWRQSMDTSNGAYYVGTNDWSYVFIHTPFVGNLLQAQYGFDVYGTCDGVHWWLDTQNAYGDGLYNFGARTMVSTSSGFYIGSANHTQGTTVYRYTGQTRPCKPANMPLADAGVSGPPLAPSNLALSMTATGPKLTWTPTAGAVSYQILRASYVTTNQVKIIKPPTVDGFQLADIPPTVAQQSSPSVQVPGAFSKIASTRGGMFTDKTAVSGQRYLYEVVAVGSDGSKSMASNVVSTPTS